MTLTQRGRPPDKIMINTHPQRWEDRVGPWVKELVWRNVKNGVKWAGLRLGLLRLTPLILYPDVLTGCVSMLL